MFINGRFYPVFAPEGAATAGEATAGEATAGEATAGEATAGEATAGEATAGEATAGEATANWRETLPEDLRGRMEKFSSPTDVAKAYAELEARQSEAITLPGADASEGQVAAFRKKLGIPETAEAYVEAVPAPEIPDGGPVSAEQAQGTVAKFAGIAHEHNIPPAAFKALSEAYFADLSAAHAEAIEGVTKAGEAAAAALDREWGRDAEANNSFSKRPIAQFDPDGEFREFLNDKTVDGMQIGNHPAFRKFFARLGRSMSERTAVLEPTEQEVADVNKQAADLRQQVREALNAGDNALARKLDEQERALYAKMPKR